MLFHRIHNVIVPNVYTGLSIVAKQKNPDQFLVYELGANFVNHPVKNVENLWHVVSTRFVGNVDLDERLLQVLVKLEACGLQKHHDHVLRQLRTE